MVIKKTGQQGRKSRKNISRMLRVLLWGTVLLALFALTAMYLLEPARLGAAAQRALITALGVEVHIGKTRLHFRHGIGVSLEDVMIPGLPGLSTPVQAEEVFLGLELAPLLNREVAWRSIRLYKPVIRVERTSNGRWLLPIVSLGGRDKESSNEGGSALGTAGFFVKRIAVHDGTIQFHDRARPGGSLKLKVRNLQVDVRNLAFGRTMQLAVSALVDQPDDTAQLSLQAAIQLPQDLSWPQIQIDGRLRVKHLWGDLFFPYYSRYVPMKHIGGRVTLDGTYRGNLAGIFRTVSQVVMEHAVFDYPDAFEQRLTAPRLEVNTDVSLDRRNLIIGPTVVRFPEGTIRGRCSLFDLRRRKLRIDAAASTDTFRLEQVRKYIPTPILPPDVARFIRSVQGKGALQIISGGTAGIVHNYPQMKSKKHWGMVWVQASLENGELKVPGLPEMSGIRGTLNLGAGKLEASDIRFNALGGQWTARGSIDSLYSRPELSLELEGDSDLTVAHEFALGSDARIFKKLKKDIEAIRGRSRQTIKISGVLSKSDLLEIDGDVRIEGVSLETRLLPHQVTGASGVLHFDGQRVSWGGIKGALGRSRFLTKGTFTNYRDKHSLLDALIEMRLDARDITPLINTSGIENLTLEGTGKMNLRVTGPLDRPNLVGKMAMDRARIALLPWVEKPVGVGADFELRGFMTHPKEFIVERMELRMADALVAGKGRIYWGEVPRVEIDLPSIVVDLSSLAPVIPTTRLFQPSGRIIGRLTCSDWPDRTPRFQFDGEMRLQKVSLQVPGLVHPITQLNGRISMQGNVLSFHQVSARVGASDITMNGTMQGYHIPRVHLSFRSRKFSIDDFIFPEMPDKKPPATASSKLLPLLRTIEGEAHISMGELHFQQLDLQSLAADLKIRQGVLGVENGTFRLGAGSLRIDGMANLGEAHGKPFRVNLDVRDMDVSRTLALRGGIGSFMTGMLDLDGSVQGMWGGSQPLAGTLSGKISIDLREGIIRKHALLSRLFSLLNVSQFLGGRFPDLTTKGLPYHRITADGTLVEGVIHTDNFFLDGDSMKIAAAGQIDTAHGTIDMKMGVQPLLSVDYVLNKLPIVGPILTGQNKGLITVYYLVKGSLREPEIIPVPIQSLGEGVVGIFGRLLNTPAHLLNKFNGMLKDQQND
ncbi:MAG: AsmA-like C-terminal domain-containing protein [Deltaproteobacteria bacterium]|nr:AsmA-like C-terminal domain-containing protein [Deltaproteobacteria bacterium]